MEPNVSAGHLLKKSHASAALAIAVGWSSAVTKGRIGASPHPTEPLLSSTLMATFSTLSNLDDAMVKGAIKGTFSGLFSALCTSTVKVSIKFLNPKVIGLVAAGEAEEAMILEKAPDFLAGKLVKVMELEFFELLVKRAGEDRRKVWDSDFRWNPVESIW